MTNLRDVNFLVGGQQMSLPFGPKPERGVSFLRTGARRFAQQQGRSYDPTGLDEMQADSHLQQRVAQTYLSLAPHVGDARVARAYAALRDETHAQFDYLTTPEHLGGLGVNVEFHDKDPYGSHEEMINDLRDNRRLKVLKSSATGGAPHEHLDEETNDKFRAVHDAFGHAAIGRSFTRHGEEAAFHSHRQMFSPTAVPALATETRGQNSVLNYSDIGGFPEQKAAVMPAWAAADRRRFGPQFGPRPKQQWGDMMERERYPRSRR